MYLKSLTLKGFKSFASSTTLQLEPGITCIVGPNGSGKSNVVDALAWVMGEQGAKTLRGGKMEDVIFAGTSGRPPLGRAEVLLTIDNSDGALPIEYAEVTISRTMFRSGGSEYAINGTPCRLLDVQELLSDSGIGREMHVIVGQGQLDTILHATPEDRRGFIEEAAGVLKHRKRKEKALRKLDSTEGNLHRLGDLLSEIRRQLKPLGRQAEVARRAAGVQADVRDARARLLADDLVTARTALEQELADETILVERRAEVEAAIAAGPADRRPRSRRRCARTCRRWRGPRRPGSRCPGCASGCAAPSRWPPSGSATPAASRRPVESGRDPEQLEAEAAQVARAGAGDRRRGRRSGVRRSRRPSPAARRPRTPPPRRSAGSPASQRAAADRREGLARLHGQVNALKSRAAAADDEVGRLGQAREEAVARAERAQRDFTALETRIAGLDAGEEGLDAEHEVAVADARRPRGAAGQDPRGGAAGRPRPGLARGPQGRPRDGPQPQGRRRRAAGRLRRRLRPARLGRRAAVGAHRLRDRRRRAPSARAADAVVVADADAAVGALGHLKADDLGRAGLLLGGAPVTDRDWPGLPAGATYAVDVVDAPADLRGALTRLLFKTRRRRRPRRRPGAGRRAARRDRGDPRRRRPRRPLRRPAAPAASRA